MERKKAEGKGVAQEAETNPWDNPLKREKDLFWLLVLEVSTQD